MIMPVIFTAAVILAAALYILSRGRYDDYIKPLDKKKYPLKQFLNIGFFIMDSANYTYSTRYDRTLQNKLSELNGSRYSFYYMQVHWANRITTMVSGILLLSFIGVGVGPDPGFGIFALIIISVLAIAADIELDKQISKRRLTLRIDFPEFINKLTLLINAGMTISRAWEKIASSNNNQRPLYDELLLALTEIKGGKPEFQAYEDFAARCRIPEITKFVSVILQNLRKGNAELVAILRLQSAECWEMRKSTAKKLGEEASTKMLMPMMIMFLAILVIIMVPAVLSLVGIM